MAWDCASIPSTCDESMRRELLQRHYGNLHRDDTNSLERLHLFIWICCTRCMLREHCFNAQGLTLKAGRFELVIGSVVCVCVAIIIGTLGVEMHLRFYFGKIYWFLLQMTFGLG